MRHDYGTFWAGIATLAMSFTANADPDLDQKMRDPANWAVQAGDYASQRWSDLKQINAGNAHRLQVAWTLSTGVLRGHEGSPLVLGETMYVHTPFPNNVYALNLADQTFKWKYERGHDTGRTGR
jgi:glucose dehydrogenase